MIPYSVEFEPGGGVNIEAPCTPVMANEWLKNSLRALWNSASQPGFMLRVMATWMGSLESDGALMTFKREG